MSVISKSPKILLMLATVAVPATVAFAQPQGAPDSDLSATYTAPTVEGPEIKGIISAREGDQVQITAADGTRTVVSVNGNTRIKSSGGFLGLSRNELGPEALLNGLPVTVETLQWDAGLLASKISLKNNDLKTASMIQTGTAQGFAMQTAATDELRGRMGDIDQYNIKGTINVNFDTGMSQLSPEAKNELCATASSAEGMKNAMLLVVGYTDSTGDIDFNQELSEKRAGRVVNHLQQACGWKPYRMLTPAGMATADPLASNDTVEGKAQNRRVAVNILVSKGLDGL